jgi:Lipid A 3-O-deacylase (PagL)
MNRPRFLALASVVLAAPAAAQDFVPRSGVPAPPIPDGPMLEVPKEARRPKWLEDGADIIPAGATDAPRMLPTAGPLDSALDRFGDGCSTSSACQFDALCQDGVFACGTTSTQFLAGAYFSGQPGPKVPTFNYVPVSVRYGNWFAGQTYYLRYNYVEPGWSIVPYHQIGLGWLLNDAHKDQTQRAIGQLFEFYLHFEVGVKCFLAPNLSLDLEGGLQHISNANLAGRNMGVNAFGGQIGFTYYFPAGGS